VSSLVAAHELKSPIARSQRGGCGDERRPRTHLPHSRSPTPGMATPRTRSSARAGAGRFRCVGPRGERACVGPWGPSRSERPRARPRWPSRTRRNVGVPGRGGGALVRARAPIPWRPKWRPNGLHEPAGTSANQHVTAIGGSCPNRLTFRALCRSSPSKLGPLANSEG
jgi:hypothetical protein